MNPTTTAAAQEQQQMFDIIMMLFTVQLHNNIYVCLVCFSIIIGRKIYIGFLCIFCTILILRAAAHTQFA